MRALRQAVCLVAAVLMVAPCAWAKGTSLAGRVLDANGAAVAGAAVRVASRAGTVRVATTSKEGAFEVEGLPEGTYFVEVTALGFRAETRENVEVSAGASPAVDVTLSVAAVSEEVTVTAAGTPQARDEVAKSIDVVSRDEADARQEIALPEALTTVAGLRVQRQGGPGSLTTLRFRGLRYQDTSILVDGLRMRDASDLYGSFGSFFEDLLLTGLERVEIVRGAGSTLYGTNAVGGVVNLIPVRGAGAPRFEALAEGGSLGLFHGRFSGSGGTERLGYSFGVDQVHVRDGVDGNDDYRNSSLAGRVAYRLSDRMELAGTLLYSDSEVDLNGNPYFFTTGTVAPIPAVFVDAPDDPDDFREGRFFGASLRFDHAVNDVWSYTARFSSVTTRRVFLSGPEIAPDFAARFRPVSFDSDFDGVGDVSGFGNSDFRGDVETVDVRNRFVLGSHNLVTAGFEVERERFSQYFFGPFGSSRQAYNAFGADFDFDGVNDASRDRQWTWAAFAYDQINLLDGRLQLGLGARVQGFRVGDTEAFFGTTNLERPEDGQTQTVPAGLEPLDEDGAVTGDGSIAYSFRSTGTRVWAHVGNSFRAPSLYERFSNLSSLQGINRAGDPTLKSELSITADGGLEQTAFDDRLRVGATYFYTRSQRLIDYASFFNPVTFASDDPLGLGRFAGYVNTRGGISRGVEVTGSASPIRSLDLKAAYTFVASDTVLASGVTLEDGSRVGAGQSYRAAGIPRHTFALQAVERIGRFTIALDLVSQSEHDAQLFEPAFFASRRFTFDGYTKADLSAGYTIPVNDRVAVTLFGRVENLTDTTIRENGILLPGATGTGGVKVRF